MQGLPDAVLNEISPESLVVVEASPEAVAQRRDEETYRDYPERVETEIRFHQQLNRNAAFVYSSKASATLHHVTNEGDVEEAADKMVQILE